MKQFKITITVDEDILKDTVTGYSGTDTFNIKDQIEHEFGWINESGIYIDEIDECQK